MEKTLALQRRLLKEGKREQAPFSPLTEFSLSGSQEDRLRGEKLLSEGKAGCLLVAGGQGTRLNFKGPKGTFPISPLQNKSLFQIFAEKTIAASQKAGIPLKLAIMTSLENDEETRAFFESRGNFGLRPEQLVFFSQGELPFLTDGGEIILDGESKIAKGPDGNGASLFHFVRSGIWEKWHGEGIRFLNFAIIDNPLADPFDAELLGFLERKNGDAAIKAVRRSDPHEKVGVIVKRGKRTEVVEYSELPEKNGDYPLANISLFCLAMPFVKKAAEGDMPYHLARKKIPGTDRTGWKFEKFIFDFLPLADKIEVLVYPREECFAPLKNPSGEASPETVRKALMERDRKVLSEITGTPVPEGPIEIGQQFYYPTPELINKWRGKIIRECGIITP